MLRLRIREIAQTQGMSLRELRHASGLDSATTRRYWHSHVQRVTLATLEAIAQALGVTIGDLFVTTPQLKCESVHDQDA